jgi:hypothetical protein
VEMDYQLAELWRLGIGIFFKKDLSADLMR